MQLICLYSEGSSKLVEWIQQRDKYTPGEMQDEMIKIMQLCHNTIAV